MAILVRNVKHKKVLKCFQPDLLLQILKCNLCHQMLCCYIKNILKSDITRELDPESD